jgi:hypothetical protein
MLVAESSPVESYAVIGRYKLQLPTKKLNIIADRLEVKNDGTFSYTSATTNDYSIESESIIKGRWWRRGNGIHFTPGLTLDDPKDKAELEYTASYGLRSYWGVVKSINTGIETHDPYWLKMN